MGKPLTKVWRCPTCNAGFKGSEVRENGKAGRRCPNGHMHSYYELGRHEQGKPINVGKGAYPRPAKVAPLRAEPLPNRARKNDKADLLALLWVAAYEKVIDQLPASSSRLLVEGAMDQAYRVSQMVLAPETAERMAA